MTRQCVLALIGGGIVVAMRRAKGAQESSPDTTSSSKPPPRDGLAASGAGSVVDSPYDDTHTDTHTRTHTLSDAHTDTQKVRRRAWVSRLQACVRGRSKRECVCVGVGVLVGVVLGVWKLWGAIRHSRRVGLEFTRKKLSIPHGLRHHCEHTIGPPRVVQVTDDIYVAIGYDLANTILIRTSEGHVVVDVGMSTERAQPMREALEEAAGRDRVHTIVYTHSHMDHVGGAAVWSENGTRIWATDALMPHFFKQYGVMKKAESMRGSRQFGKHAPISEIPCSGIGRKTDMFASLRGMNLVAPTDTFSGSASFEVGGLTFEVIEAHGETHDQLFVWVPERKTLLPGDNFYASFPNLYTIRGTTARPIRAWIKSLDEMRRLEPEYLVPSHTQPVVGKEEIARQLTVYRDAIQWVFTSVVQGANEGKSIDQLAEEIELPPHLKDQPILKELYGQLDWSVRAIYTNELGWFDGRAEDLYPIAFSEERHRLVEMAGGTQRIVKLLRESVEKEDYKWALYLIRLLKDGAKGDTQVDWDKLRVLEIRSLRSLGEDVTNTNGRGYLLQSALELAGQAPVDAPVLHEEFIRSIPIDLIFEVLINRVRQTVSMDVHQTALYVIGGRNYYLTVRRGVAEIWKDKPLYGTPDPVGAFTSSEDTFRRIALKLTTPAREVLKGTATINGDMLGFAWLLGVFQTGA